MLAGVEGSLKYREGPFQYSQASMWRHIFRLVPGLFRNRLAHGRYLDIFISHSPPLGLHDQDDLPHQGIKAFRWLISVFQPAYFFHGHIHLHRPDEVTETQFETTRVINAYGFRQTDVNIGQNSHVPCR
jgi:Icc-related predicted phosphoesterase